MIYQVVKRFIDSSHAHFCFVLVIKLSLQVSFDSVVHVVLTFFFFALNISFLLIVNVFLFFSISEKVAQACYTGTHNCRISRGIIDLLGAADPPSTNLQLLISLSGMG